MKYNWCDQHGYPLPCNKCGMGERELGRKDVIDWCNKNFEPTVPMTLDYEKWHKQLKKWGIE